MPWHTVIPKNEPYAAYILLEKLLQKINIIYREARLSPLLSAALQYLYIENTLYG